jgi:voltage-gated potassium channel
MESLQERKIPVFHGDATHDEMLEKMQIRKAKGVITVLNNDADNVFTVLSCRQLNPQLRIVARSVEHSSEAKLMKAGADVVVSPNEIGGQRMAVLALNTAITNVMEIVSNEEDNLINVFEIRITPGSKLVGQTLQEANIRVRTGLTVFAIIRSDDKILKWYTKTQ